MLDSLGVSARDATRPQVLASKIITMLDPQHAFLINRNKIGSMALAGESVFVLEMQPASYAILATNEAEKAARIKVVDYRMIGATGRVYLSGSEADVRQAAEAAEEALRSPVVERERRRTTGELRALVREVLSDLLPARWRRGGMRRRHTERRTLPAPCLRAAGRPGAGSGARCGGSRLVGRPGLGQAGLAHTRARAG